MAQHGDHSTPQAKLSCASKCTAPTQSSPLPPVPPGTPATWEPLYCTSMTTSSSLVRWPSKAQRQQACGRMLPVHNFPHGREVMDPGGYVSWFGGRYESLQTITPKTGKDTATKSPDAPGRSLPYCSSTVLPPTCVSGLALLLNVRPPWSCTAHLRCAVQPDSTFPPPYHTFPTPGLHSPKGCTACVPVQGRVRAYTGNLYSQARRPDQEPGTGAQERPGREDVGGGSQGPV